jgi:hypothetical protein
MRYFDENGPYWGNTAKKLVSVGGDRLTSRSVKIFADGALRSGGAAVRLFLSLTFNTRSVPLSFTNHTLTTLKHEGSCGYHQRY